MIVFQSYAFIIIYTYHVCMCVAFYNDLNLFSSYWLDLFLKDGITRDRTRGSHKRLVCTCKCFSVYRCKTSVADKGAQKRTIKECESTVFFHFSCCS